eukprot:64770-Amorphochlora_amoeboformis.AAC.1
MLEITGNPGDSQGIDSPDTKRIKRWALHGTNGVPDYQATRSDHAMSSRTFPEDSSTLCELTQFVPSKFSTIQIIELTRADLDQLWTTTKIPT